MEGEAGKTAVLPGLFRIESSLAVDRFTNI
jgi:hypothetical protein